MMHRGSAERTLWKADFLHRFVRHSFSDWNTFLNQ